MARRLVALLACLALLVAGCTNGDRTDSERLTVFAAASLQGAFDEMATAFTAADPRYRVAPIVYDGSQALATQIAEGADADVVAFADEASLAPLIAEHRTDTASIFATNTLQIAVAPGNPKHIRGLVDLARKDVTVVLCASEVPCGTAARTLLSNARVTVSPVSEETNVTSVVTRVKAGEADAGLVYATDVTAGGRGLEGVIPEGASTVVNRYPIALTSTPSAPEAARAFRDFVLSEHGREILSRYGFGAP